MSTLTQPPPEHRTPLPVRRALMILASLFGVCAVAFCTVSLLDLASRHTTTERSSYDGVRSLVVEGASDLTLTGAAAGESLEVVARITEGLRSPSHSAQRTGDGELRLSASCPGFFGDWCDVDYEIRVPSGTVVRADASGGDVVAEELTTTEPLRLETSAGDVSAIDVTAPAIELSSSAGDVSGSALSADEIVLESSAGDVSASLRTPAERLRADSSAGDVDLAVPDAVYRLDATSSAGDVDTSELSTDRDAPRAIVARSSAGDVTVILQR
jgi:Putative adhesin